MCRINACLLALLFLSLPAAICSMQAQQPASKIEFVVLEDPEASGLIDKTKIANCIHLVAHELHEEDRELPKIVVYHVSQKSADFIGIGSASTWRTRGNGQFRYEVWLIDEPSNTAYSLAVESILEQYFSVSLGRDERAKILQHVARELNETINVKAFR
jgi:hypothetical protein